MENDFSKWWQKQKNNFDVSKPMDPSTLELIILAVAHNAWNKATEIATQQSLELTDTIMCSEGTHAFYKKNPGLI